MGDVEVAGAAGGEAKPAASEPSSPDVLKGLGRGGSGDLGEASNHSGIDNEWSISESMTAKTYEADKFGFWQATAMNTLNMFGTGPFITVPFLFAATVPPGPQALIGYGLAAIFCICDSTIWGELSSMVRARPRPSRASGVPSLSSLPLQLREISPICTLLLPGSAINTPRHCTLTNIFE
mmetsp:Transcript_35208/g.99682  ORF Transcript_35208/g.99682 Transcript_35208/m.99682 type:complete len:180 (+) Transcript_35208:235-774(+)|eukprot:CAMPEP_0117649572 /NCGR_PEP_ID=MMETSP0804-20121206/1047_1 /TAXON_ID=1074897 /ORGANISM="Tetraselmis astigmatica, Strain CCMP880" /LENGTH=179 /DNA_ID=CAMNT_0005455325 /DNA_START=168 /DNA_END=707 /DNA_ORIENTATION=+